MITITHLYRHPEHVRRVARWIYDEFWTDKPDASPQWLEERLREATTDSEIPMSWLAVVDNEPAGTVNLIECDNDQRPDLSPWLAALLVLPEYRKRGIGSKLVDECVAGARRLGVKRLYLGTDIPEYYERLGWHIHERVRGDYIIMAIDLD
jgi:predicted N-acetyltransferase YhbS